MKSRIPGALCALLVCLSDVPQGARALPPAPYGPVPTDGQLRWHELEFYGFIHFGLNTFTDQEWGFGDTPPKVFNPAAFNAEEIVLTMKAAGVRGLVLVCKHHDGFCLWTSRYTEYSVKQSPWRGGDGDMVREFADACRKHTLEFGVYLSPWDRNHKDYGRPEYLAYYRNQLAELLTNYGEVFIAWFDGATGGEGYYGGSREKRQIDNRTYYDWPRTWELVRRLQPHAVIFSDAGPDVRWVGNEHGTTGDPCWAAIDLTHSYPGMPNSQTNQVGSRTGPHWAPPECDVSIRPRWFYHARDDLRLKTMDELKAIYFNSVGRGACLNLNVPPDKRGKIHEKDAARLLEFGRWLNATFTTNLVKGAKVSASSTRAEETQFSAANVLDGNRNTYWASADEVKAPELVVDLGKPVTFNILQLREYLPLGQRVEAFAIDTWRMGQWRELTHATSIGSQRLLRFPKPVTAEKLRLRITQSPVCPAISEFGLFLEPQ